MTQPVMRETLAERNVTAPQGGGGGGGTFGFAIVNAVDVDAPIIGTLSTAVFVTAMTADRTVTLPVAPIAGEVVKVKDGDGSLAAHNIIVSGNGKNIDGAATFTMSAFPLGTFGAIELVYNGASWGIT